MRKYSQEFKKDLRALEREGWNQSRAARGLGVHRNTLITRLALRGFRRDRPASGNRAASGDETA